MDTFQLKHKELKKKLKKWNKEEFGHIIKDQNEINKCMAEFQQQTIYEGRSEELVQEEGMLIN